MLAKEKETEELVECTIVLRGAVLELVYNMVEEGIYSSPNEFARDAVRVFCEKEQRYREAMSGG